MGRTGARVSAPSRWWTDLAVNATLRSPWARHALRTGIALALAAALVEVVEISHGYWVLLGVVSVLRVDAASTGAQAIRAVVGAFIGVLIGLLIATQGAANPDLLWVLTPVAAFFVGWAPRAVGALAGQAAFSAFVMILLAAESWPPQYATAIDRVVDIGVGVATAAVVSLLMWPTRMVPALRISLASAVSAAIDYLHLAVQRVLGQATAEELRRAWVADRATVRRAGELFDLTVLQRRDVDAVTSRWARVAGSTQVLMYTGIYIATLPDVTAPLLPAHAGIVDSEMDRTAHAWNEVIAWLRSDAVADSPDGLADPYIELAEVSSALDLSDEQVAASLAAAVWTLDWLNLLGSLADQAVMAS